MGKQRWMWGVAKKYNTRNEHMKGSVKLVSMAGRSHRKKFEGTQAGAKKNTRCTGTRKGTVKRQMRDSCYRDMESVGLKQKDAMNWRNWKREVQHYCSYSI